MQAKWKKAAMAAVLAGAGIAFAAQTGVAQAGSVTAVYVDGCGYAGGVYRVDDHVVYRVGGYPWCVTPAAAYYAAAYAWTHPAYVTYVAYAPAAAGYVYATGAGYRAGYAYGSAGAAAWGPYGGVAATTGAHAYRNGDRWGVEGASAAYNPWTGNGAAVRTRAGYDAATGTYGVGQRGGVGNAYTGDYAYGERGAVYNERTGAAAAGSHATVGNAYTGREVEVGRGAVYNPATGQTTTAAGVHGENGGAARVGGDFYVSRNGEVRQVGNGQQAGTRPAGTSATRPANASSTRPATAPASRPGNRPSGFSGSRPSSFPSARPSRPAGGPRRR